MSIVTSLKALLTATQNIDSIKSNRSDLWSAIDMYEAGIMSARDLAQVGSELLQTLDDKSLSGNAAWDEAAQAVEEALKLPA